MKSIYETFEFPLIKERLKDYAYTQLAREYCQNLEMYNNVDDLVLSLDELNEAINYCYKYGRINIFNHNDLSFGLDNIKKGGIPSKEFFYQISFLLENIDEIKKDYKESSNYQFLSNYVLKLDELSIVKQKIDRIISPTLDIYDNASSNLYRIRNKILHLQNSISSISNSLISKYQNYLESTRSTLRNGIFTLMVKSTYKNRIQGIVHDISDSGQTYFVEPQELIDVYNQISSLKEEENREIQNILKELSIFINSYHYELVNNNFLISKIDFIFAKASYACSYSGEICKISKTKKIHLEDAAHPLIDSSVVVRNSFDMEKEKMMIITGPNAGGKTVSLKLVGLLVIMHQSGLALPIKEGGEMSFFDNIYADIGDNQSILDNLSTFSSHIIKIKEILNNVNENSLVIIDELCSGTSPLDGEAIGLGIISYLLEKKCFSLISSHYEAIKSFALENENVLCASMVFDKEKILPTYKLRLYVASSSYGIEISEIFGLQKEVITKAREYIEKRKVTDKELKLNYLNKKIEEVENIKIDLLEKEKEINDLKIALNNEIQKQKEIRNNILLAADNEKRKIVEEAKEEIDNLFKDFKNLENIKLHQVISVKKKIDDKLVDIEDEDNNDVINVNDEVEIISSKTRGKVIRIDHNKAYIVTDNNLSIQTKLSSLRKVEIIKKKKHTYVPDFTSKMKKVPTECNVIGLTVKEALDVVSKYLDDAVTVHFSQVRIIHGSGTGRLRSGIHEYLKKSIYVDSFRLGGAGEGGVGATVVKLK